MKRNFAVFAIVNDEGFAACRSQKFDDRETRKRPARNTFETRLERAAPRTVQSPMLAELTRDLRKPIRTSDKHDARHRERMRHRRVSLDRDKRNHAAKRMRNNGAKRTEVTADHRRCTRTFDEIGGVLAAQTVCRQIEQNDAISGPPYGFGDGRHE